MTDKDFSKGAGQENEAPIRLPSGEGKKDIFGEDAEKPEPWDALRPVQSKPEEPKPPSRIGIFFRKALRWTTGIIFIFGLGVVTAWFVRVQPQDVEIRDLENRIQAAEITVEQLEAQITDLLPLDVENQQLLEELSESQLHVDVMKALIDATSAQLALAMDDVVTAKASLSGTDARLAALQDQLQGDDQQTLEGIRTRLSLVLEELEKDTEIAMNDLEVLSSNLIALERSLFGD